MGSSLVRIRSLSGGGWIVWETVCVWVWHAGGERGKAEICAHSVLSIQFCCGPKSALKDKAY